MLVKLTPSEECVDGHQIHTKMLLTILKIERKNGPLKQGCHLI